jgi:hypothetical protein
LLQLHWCPSQRYNPKENGEMKKSILLTLTLAMVVLAIAACGGPPTPVPTPLPPPTVGPAPTQVLQPTAAPQPSTTQVPPTAAPTTSGPTAVTPVPATAAPTTSAPTAATAVPATVTTAPASTPASPAAVPGLYVTNIRLDPSQPAHAQDTSFFVTFLNTASTENNQKWQVYIYKADNPARRNNETTVLQTPFQPGSIELKAIGTFKYGATGNACDFFFAIVVTLDQNNKGIELTKPGELQRFEKGFSICQ